MVKRIIRKKIRRLDVVVPTPTLRVIHQRHLAQKQLKTKISVKSMAMPVTFSRERVIVRVGDKWSMKWDIPFRTGDITWQTTGTQAALRHMPPWPWYPGHISLHPTARHSIKNHLLPSLTEAIVMRVQAMIIIFPPWLVMLLVEDMIRHHAMQDVLPYLEWRQARGLRRQANTDWPDYKETFHCVAMTNHELPEQKVECETTQHALHVLNDWGVACHAPPLGMM